MKAKTGFHIGKLLQLLLSDGLLFYEKEESQLCAG